LPPINYRQLLSRSNYARSIRICESYDRTEQSLKVPALAYEFSVNRIIRDKTWPQSTFAICAEMHRDSQQFVIVSHVEIFHGLIFLLHPRDDTINLTVYNRSPYFQPSCLKGRVWINYAKELDTLIVSSLLLRHRSSVEITPDAFQVWFIHHACLFNDSGITILTIFELMRIANCKRQQSDYQALYSLQIRC